MLRVLCFVSVFSSAVFMSGQTPLHDAVRWRDVEWVHLLLDHGTDIDAAGVVHTILLLDDQLLHLHSLLLSPL